MTALTAPRKTQQRDGNYFTAPLAAGVKIFAGAFVVIDSAGWARPGRASTTDKPYGEAEHTVDNTNGANGDVKVRVRRGIFNAQNSTAGDALTFADVGNSVYLVDDQTVAKTSNTNTRIVAGKLVDFDGDGPWIQYGVGL